MFPAQYFDISNIILPFVLLVAVSLGIADDLSRVHHIRNMNDR